MDRYAELGAGAEKFGADGAKALELLVARGVTAAVIAEAQALLKTLTQVAPTDVSPSADEQEEDLEQAEAAMWAWFLEWSQIARVAIKQRSLLKELGFLGARRGGEDEGETEADANAPGGTSASGAAVNAAASAASAAAPAR